MVRQAVSYVTLEQHARVDSLSQFHQTFSVNWKDAGAHCSAKKFANQFHQQMKL
jgi:hypothetical protein